MDNGLLNLVLSSAVIVAIINLFIQNRNNKLQYITNYRSKWREQLRKSVANLEKSSRYDDKCRQIFTKIKINLNSYGYCADGNYPDDSKLNIMKDQHIWKTLHMVEQGDIDFEDGKKRLQDYISLLLKFDWERRKEEASSDTSLIISVFLYWGSVLIGIMFRTDFYVNGKFNVAITKIMIVLLLYFIPFILLWGPRFLDCFKNFRKNKWYKDTNIWLVMWIMGCFALIYVYFATTSTISANIVSVGMILFFIIAFMIMVDSAIEKKLRYATYENQVIKTMKGASFYLYQYKPSFHEMWIYDKFYDLNIRVRWEYYHNNIDKYEDLLDELAQKYPQKALKWHSRLWLKLCKNKLSWKEFVMKKPKRLKPILKYKDKYYLGYMEIRKMKC